MIRRLRDASGAGTGDEAMDTAVRRGMADLLTALDNVIDDDAALARVYAAAGQTIPGGPAADPSWPTKAEQVCTRIGMLESAVITAVNAQPRASFLGTASRHSVRRYLDEFRTGRKPACLYNAFGLPIYHRDASPDADMVLRRQHDLPLPQSVLAQIADLRQLSVDLLGQLDSIQEEVMRLFGHSGDSAPVLVPQH